MSTDADDVVKATPWRRLLLLTAADGGEGEPLRASAVGVFAAIVGVVLGLDALEPGAVQGARLWS